MMCKFCKNILTGNDLKPILEGDINGAINGYYNVYLSMSPYIRRPILQTDIVLLNTPIVMDDISVKYCPMCGASLEKLEE